MKENEDKRERRRTRSKRKALKNEYPPLVSPLLHLTQFVDDKNTSSLCSGRRLDDPRGVRLAFELLDEEAIVAREHIGTGDHV